MIERLLEQGLRRYRPANALERELALVELIQQYVLAGLSQAGLFRQALFHGGTSLRILHRTSRFSEDLDFMLKAPDPSFRWLGYLEHVRDMAAREGFDLAIRDRSEVDAPVKKGFLKTDSLGTLLLFELPFARDARKKVLIKLEIDTCPPEGSHFETAYLTFPFVAAITTQTLASGFGTKSHALLCRPYVKGRDWYDLLWYVDRSVAPDLQLLQNAIDQQGPWAKQRLQVTPAWYLAALAQKIAEVDWALAREDVRRFLPATEQRGIELWSQELFLFQLRRLAQVIENQTPTS